MRVGELKKKILAQNENLELQVKKDLAFQVARHFEEARLVRGLTQVRLAQKVGTSQSNIARAENGSALPSLSFLKRVADALNTYLIPPKFAFMEELKARIDTNAIASFHDIPSRNNMSPITSNREGSNVKEVTASLN